MGGCVECHLYNRLLLITSCKMEYTEYILPAGLYVMSLRIHHLCNTPDNHISNCRISVTKVQLYVTHWYKYVKIIQKNEEALSLQTVKNNTILTYFFS